MLVPERGEPTMKIGLVARTHGKLVQIRARFEKKRDPLRAIAGDPGLVIPALRGLDGSNQAKNGCLSASAGYD
jgi:hypothetical protein